MKNSKIWKGIAGLLVLVIAIALIPSLINSPHQTMMVEFSKAEEADGLKSYQVSLTPETSNKKIEEIGIILQTGDKIRDNLVKASSTEDDSWTVQFTVPADESVSVQPYVKYEGQEKAVVYEEATSSDDSVITKTPVTTNPVREAVLADGANAAYTCPASEIPQALAMIADETWGDDDVVQINVSGEAAFDDAILFGQNTIFAASGKRLPIVIVGDGTAVLDLNASVVTSANSFTFRDLKMPIGAKDVTFYAGAGNVVFENVDFGVEDGKGSARFYGDTATSDVFANWTSATKKANKEAELIPTSITFSGTTSYTPKTNSGVLMSAVGFGGKWLEGSETAPLTSPSSLSTSFIIDGATVSSVGARAGTAPVAKAYLTMKNGSASKLAADGATSAVIGEAYTGDTYLSIEGGSIRDENGIVAFTNAVHNGDVYVSISQENNETRTTILGDVIMCAHAEIRGSAYLYILGGQVQGDVYGAASSVTTYNNIIDTSIEGSFYGTSDNARRVVNNFTGSSVSGDFVGGTNTDSITRGVTNTIASTTVSGDFIGANRSTKLYGKIKNAISDSTFEKNLIAGNEIGDVSGKISNTVAGTTVAMNFISGNESGNALAGICNTLKQVNTSGSLYGGNFGGDVLAGGITNKFTDVNVTGATHGGNETGKVEGDIQNIICGNNGSFNSFFGGNAQGDINGSIKNTVSGGTFRPVNDTEVGTAEAPQKISFFAGTNGQYSTVKGNIENEISGGTFHNYWYAGNRFSALTGNIVNTVSGGTFYTFNGGGFGTMISGNITNTIKDGRFHNSFAGGNRGKIDVLSTSVQDIENTVEGGTFSGDFWLGASVNGTVNGSITNHVTGGEFSSNTEWHGGSSIAVSTIENTFNGGIFNASVYGGNSNTNANGDGSGSNQNVTNTVKSGTFNGAFYGGANTAPISGTVQNTVEGGTFVGAFYGGSYKGSNAAIINTVKNGTFNGAFHGATNAATVSSSIRNSFEGGTFTAEVYGGSANVNIAANITNTFKGGTFEETSAVYGGSAAKTVSGKIENTVEGATFNGAFHGGNNAGSNAAVTNTVKSGTFNGAFHGASNAAGNTGVIQNNFEGGIFEASSTVYGGSAAGTVSGTIQNTFNGSTFNGAVYGGNNEGSNQKIINTVKSSTFNGAFHGASNAANNISTIQNKFEGGTFNAEVYGGAGTGNVNTTVTNSFTGGNFNGNFGEESMASVFGGSAAGTVSGTIQNTFDGGTFAFNVYGGNNEGTNKDVTNTVENGTFSGTFFGASYNATNGSIQNTFNGGTYESIRCGSYYGNTTGITNLIQGGVFNGEFAGGNASPTVNNYEAIVNTFKGGTFNNTNAARGIHGGGIGKTGNVTNNFFGGTFNCAVHGGSKNSSVRNVTNNVNGGDFKGMFFGASYKADVSASYTVKNVFKGGTFDDAVYCGSQNAESVISGKVDNTFYAGTFNKEVYGGSDAAKITGSITNTFGDSTNTIKTAATFNGTVYGGSQNQTATINKVTSTLSRGNFFGNVYPGNAVNNYGSATDCAYMEIAIHNQAENTLRFNGEVKSLHGEAECVKLTNTSVSSTRANILIGENAYLKLDEYSNNEEVYLGGKPDGGAVSWSGHVCQSGETAAVPGTIANAKISKYQPFVVDSEKAPNGLTSGKVYLEYPRVERTFVLTCGECGYELRAPMADVGIKVYGNASVSEDLQESVALDGMATVENIKIFESGKTADGTEFTKKEATGYIETPDTGTVHYSTVTGTENGKKFTTVANPGDYPEVPTEQRTEWVEEEKKLTADGPNGLNSIIKVNDLLNEEQTLTLSVMEENEVTINYAENGQDKAFTDALREQVVNYFELQLSFTWTPDKSQLKYKTTNLKGESDDEDGTVAEKDGVNKLIDKGALYGGIPYQSHGNGNLYRWMEYYDETTGIFYLSQMMQDNGGYSADGTFNPGSAYFYNQCSNGANWAWMRVCNTGAAQGSASFCVARGMIPVGGFEYFAEGDYESYDMTTDYFTTKYQCPYITKTELGSKTYYEGSTRYLRSKVTHYNIYDYYRLVKPGDCISKKGHVMMVRDVHIATKTVYESQSSRTPITIIDPDNSYIAVIEEIEGWALSSTDHSYDQADKDRNHESITDHRSTWGNGNDTPYTRQGRAYYDYFENFYGEKAGSYSTAKNTFTFLKDTGYMPFTFIEFQNFDPATQTDLDRTHIEFYNTYILNNALNNVMTTRYTKSTLDLRNVSVYNPETGVVEKNQSLISKGDLVNLDENGKLIGATEKSFVKIGFSVSPSTTGTPNYVLNGYGNQTKIVATEPTITPVAENISKITYNQLQNFIVYSNYFISDVTATFTNENGTVLFEKTSRASNNAVSMMNHPGIFDASVDLQTGKNKVTISVQLSTGEKIVLLENLTY